MPPGILDRIMGNPPLRRLHLPEHVSRPAPPAAEQRAARLKDGHVIIVTGGRDYQERARVFAALDLAHGKKRITLLVHGACIDRKTGELRGADRWADEWARERGVKVEPHPADWATWGDKAGPMRNHQMAYAGAHGCIAFPGGRGTAQMIRQARYYGIPVWQPFG
jgi:hypothetical protein